MISASDARERIAQHRSPHGTWRLERLIDQAIEEACERDLCPCRLDVPAQIDAEVARALVVDYRRDGEWEIQVVSSEDGMRLLLQEPRPGAQAGQDALRVRMRARIERLAELPVDWGGSERPSRLAVGLALGIADEMDKRGHRLRGSVPFADGGVALEYASLHRLGRFDIYNDGGVVAVTRDETEAQSVMADLPLPSAIDAISGHLEGVGSEERAAQSPDAGERA